MDSDIFKSHQPGAHQAKLISSSKKSHIVRMEEPRASLLGKTLVCQLFTKSTLPLPLTSGFALKLRCAQHRVWGCCIFVILQIFDRKQQLETFYPFVEVVFEVCSHTMNIITISSDFIVFSFKFYQYHSFRWRTPPSTTMSLFSSTHSASPHIGDHNLERDWQMKVEWNLPLFKDILKFPVMYI